MIKSYKFGEIKIDDSTYSSDVIIYPDRVDDNWWRGKSHLVEKDDLNKIMKYKPEVLIIGTGAYGIMKVPINTKDYIESNGIELIVCNTRRACDIYNDLKDEKNIVAALHLTC